MKSSRLVKSSLQYFTSPAQTPCYILLFGIYILIQRAFKDTTNPVMLIYVLHLPVSIVSLI